MRRITMRSVSQPYPSAVTSGTRPSLTTLEGVYSVLPTAFAGDGALDLAGTSALARAHVGAGVAGLTVLGVMGEAAELTEDERRAVVEGVVDAAAGAPVVLGVTGPSATTVRARAGDGAALGVTGLMVSPSSTLGLEEAVEAAASAGLPVVVQDYPAGSGVRLATDQIASVARRQKLVIGIKAEAPPTSSAIAALAAALPGLGMVGGLGGLFLIDELRAGATGTMTGFPLPARLVATVSTFRSDPERAEAEWIRLLPLMRYEAFPPLSLAVRKEVWRLQGVIGSARCRREGAFLDDRLRDDIRRALEQVTGVPVT
jgi:4-hydroxy-tetrahydrodipicolinate synthase